MKSIVVLFDEKNKYEDEKVFSGKSAKELCLSAAESFGFEVRTISGLSTISELLEELDKICSESGAESLIFSYADCLFLNKTLTQGLLSTHFDYKAEYTFAEGYPEGFAPEVLDKGTIAILKELSKTTAKATGDQKITRHSLMDIIKTDINSFEVETVLAPVDWRLFRFAFDCRKKETFIACQKLYESSISNEDAVELSEYAAKSAEILKTVPAFYNLQLAQKCQGQCTYCPYPAELLKKEGVKACEAAKVMSFDNACKLIDQIADFSGEAVVGLSAWGECFNNPDLLKIIEKILSYEGLSVLIEADGCSIPENFAKEVAPIINTAPERANGWQKLMLVVSMDGIDPNVCAQLRGKDFNLISAADTVKKLEELLPGCVYPQFVRMNANEPQLEGFFRYWNEKTSESHGNFIIQKYNSFAGLLKNEEPADLSPLDRNVCWHLRRDLTILCNGDVPVCYSRVLDDIAGNVFDEGIEAVWKKLDVHLKDNINKAYCDKCGGCDEFYTFNF
ncbi:MAG: spiro-SPASM protein [Treponema sp.]|nr:spiro-SPASM protein [Treponema sp.]